MLKLRRRRHAEAPGTSLLERPELRIRNLLDDPALRRAMGLDGPEPAPERRPEPRVDRRRLLDRRAA